VLGNIVSGAPATSLTVIPYSWEGFFARSFTVPGITGTHWQRLIQLAAPFLVDGLFMLLGSWLFHWRHKFPPSVGGLVLMLTYLRALCDLVINYMGGVLSNSGDFQQLLSGYPPVAIHVCTWVLILLGLLGTWSEIGLARPVDQ
jgi:xanthine/uracil permease